VSEFFKSSRWEKMNEAQQFACLSALRGPDHRNWAGPAMDAKTMTTAVIRFLMGFELEFSPSPNKARKFWKKQPAGIKHLVRLYLKKEGHFWEHARLALELLDPQYLRWLVQALKQENKCVK